MMFAVGDLWGKVKALGGVIESYSTDDCEGNHDKDVKHQVKWKSSPDVE